MKIERQDRGGLWRTVASTGHSSKQPISITRLYDLNTVFEFGDFDTDGFTRYRVTLPDRDWLKRTDIASEEEGHQQ